MLWWIRKHMMLQLSLRFKPWYVDANPGVQLAKQIICEQLMRNFTTTTTTNDVVSAIIEFKPCL